MCSLSSIKSYPDARDLHSFPTRRSSDLDEAVPSFVSGAMAKAGKGLLEGTLQAGTSAVSDKYLQEVLYQRSEERFSRNAETDLVCRLLVEKKKLHLIAPRLLRLFTVFAS